MNQECGLGHIFMMSSLQCQRDRNENGLNKTALEPLWGVLQKAKTEEGRVTLIVGGASPWSPGVNRNEDSDMVSGARIPRLLLPVL